MRTSTVRLAVIGLAVLLAMSAVLPLPGWAPRNVVRSLGSRFRPEAARVQPILSAQRTGGSDERTIDSSSAGAPTYLRDRTPYDRASDGTLFVTAIVPEVGNPGGHRQVGQNWTDIGVRVLLSAEVGPPGTNWTGSYWSGLEPGCSTTGAPATSWPEANCSFESPGALTITLTANYSLDGTQGSISSAALGFDVYLALAAVAPEVSLSRIHVGNPINVTEPGGSKWTDPNTDFDWEVSPSASAVCGVASAVGAGSYLTSRNTTSCEFEAPGTFALSVTVSGSEAAAGPSPSTDVTVYPALTIVTFNATPSRIALGDRTVLSVTLSGGVPPFAFVYSELPPGCASADTGNLTCRPATEGNWSVEVRATDALNGTPAISGFAPLVTTAAPSASSASPSFFGLPFWAGVALAVALALSVLAVTLAGIARSRNRSGRSPQEPAP